MALSRQQRSAHRRQLGTVLVPLLAQDGLLQAAQDDGQRKTCAVIQTANSKFGVGCAIEDAIDAFQQFALNLLLAIHNRGTDGPDCNFPSKHGSDNHSLDYSPETMVIAAADMLCSTACLFVYLIQSKE